MTDVEGIDRGVANDSELFAGVGRDLKGFGSSSLAECIERVGDISGLTAPATELTRDR